MQLSDLPTTPELFFLNQQDALYYFYWVLLVVTCVLYLCKRILHLDEMGLQPQITIGAKSPVMDAVLAKCPSLNAHYKPTWLWGKSGHIQTLLFGFMHSTRKTPPATESTRHFITLADGSRVTYNVYEPAKKHESGVEITLICVPGIFGDYQKSYIQSLFGAAVNLGYRCVCLNHLGVPKDVPLTRPRLFTYGSTEEVSEMCDEVFERYPDSKFIAVGFSMGANIVCKYLGEKPERQEKFLGAMSICQGYDVLRAAKGLCHWDKIAYSYILAQRWISLVERHSIVRDEAERQGISWADVKGSRHLAQFDRLFTYKFYGYGTFEEFCNSQSSAPYLQALNIPMMIVNAKDDPLIGPFYHDIPKEAAERNENVVFVETHHGGHLGYFDGGLLFPKDVWIDGAVIDFTESLVEVLL